MESAEPTTSEAQKVTVLGHEMSQGEFAAMRSLASIMMNRAEWARNAGFTFDGKRDMSAALGYKASLNPRDYWRRYKRNGIARRIVKLIPEATWRGAGELIDDPTIVEMTPFELAWDKLQTRLSIWSKFNKADKLCGMGEYSVILMGVPGMLQNAVRPFNDPDKIVYLKPYSQDNAVVSEWDDSPSSPRYGLPTQYKFKHLGKPTDPDKSVHWNRVLHLTDDTLDDEVHSDPRLEAVWNLLDDLEKVTGGGAEAFWSRAHQGYQFNLDKEVELTPDEEKKASEEVDEFINGMRRFVRTRGMDVDVLGSDVANFLGPADAILTQLAATIGVPKRILLGSERGDLASSQDKGHWDDFISDRRADLATPVYVRQFVDRLIGWGALPKPKNDKYDVRWPQIKNLDDPARAETGRKWATLNSETGDLVVTPDEIRDHILLLPPLTQQQKDEYKSKQEEKQKQALAMKPQPGPVKPPPPEPREDR